MFLWLINLLNDSFTNFFHYISVRSIFGFFSSFLITIIFGRYIIDALKSISFSQQIRDDGPSNHKLKEGTPTMGGLMIIISIILSSLFWCSLENNYILIMLFVTIAFGFIGFIDDYKKIINQNSKGLKAKYKYILQSLFAIIAIYLIFNIGSVENNTKLIIPYIKQGVIDVGIFASIFSYFVIVGSSNAVNLTDGLDGLAIVPTALTIVALGIFCYLSGNITFSKYLVIPNIIGAGELSVFCGIVIGSCLGFLWFNSYPASVFMGDTGALSLGAIIGSLAVIVKQELILVVLGGVFVIETISVIIQVLFFKVTGKRFFKMAPLHHHFEIAGWSEPKIIIRFWIVSLLFVLLGLASLKIR